MRTTRMTETPAPTMTEPAQPPTMTESAMQAPSNMSGLLMGIDEFDRAAGQ